MSKDHQKIDLNRAYSLKTPADSKRLYADWADTYDSDFIESRGYVYHLRVVELFVNEDPQIKGPVLDVGCGTGIVGVALRDHGIEVVDGIDISPEMIAKSCDKKTEAGGSIYRNLIEADLSKSIDIEDNVYAGLISAGTFTHGHLGPESLDELWRVTAPGGVCVVGINAKHYDLLGFGDKIADDVANSRITNPEFSDVQIYSSESDESEYADDTALIVVCRAA